MRKLIRGIVDFRERLLPQYAKRFQDLAFGQEPDTLFITCSEPRRSGPACFHSPRRPFHDAQCRKPRSAGDERRDFGWRRFGSKRDRVFRARSEGDGHCVCGHSECGAMRAVIANPAHPDTPNLAKWLHHAKAAAFRLQQEGPLDPNLDPHDQLSQLNVLLQLEHLMSYAIVRDRVSAGLLRLSGLWFEVGSGTMYAYDREQLAFQVIDGQMADRMLARF